MWRPSMSGHRRRGRWRRSGRGFRCDPSIPNAERFRPTAGIVHLLDCGAEILQPPDKVGDRWCRLATYRVDQCGEVGLHRVDRFGGFPVRFYQIRTEYSSCAASLSLEFLDALDCSQRSHAETTAEKHSKPRFLSWG